VIVLFIFYSYGLKPSMKVQMASNGTASHSDVHAMTVFSELILPP